MMWSARSQATRAKIKIKHVKILWSESSLLGIEGKVYDSINKVQHTLNTIACDERKNKLGGYCKVRFEIEWEDGFIHSGRLDVTGTYYDLTAHVIEFYMMCIRDDCKYTGLLNKSDAEEFLKKYEIA